jgi:hypothetical protein
MVYYDSAIFLHPAFVSGVKEKKTYKYLRKFWLSMIIPTVRPVVI